MPGRTTKPLKILVDQSLRELEEVRELGAKGHQVCELGYSLFDAGGADLILGPNCWRMTPELIKYLGGAIKAARERKYGVNRP